MNNVALDPPVPVGIRSPSRPKREWFGRREWNIPSPVPAAVVHIEDDPVGVPFVSDGLIRSLRRRYEFRNDEAIREFLKEKPFLLHLLFDAYKEIREYFAAPHLVLEVIADPEAQEERELFVFIQTKLSPRAARPLLAEFDREWWIDAMLEARGEMNISLRYVRDER